MKKLIVLLGVSIALIGCDKDECGCYYSNEIGQYVMDQEMEQSHLDGDFVLSEEQLKAIQAECRYRQNCN